MISKKSLLHQFSESCPLRILFKQSECSNTDPYRHLCTFSGGEVNLSGAVVCHRGRFHHQLSSLRKKKAPLASYSLFLSLVYCVCLLSLQKRLFYGCMAVRKRTGLCSCWQLPLFRFLPRRIPHFDQFHLTSTVGENDNSDISDMINNTFLFFFFCVEK